MQSRDPMCFFMVCFTSIPNIRSSNSDGVLLPDPFSWDQQNFCRACPNETVTLRPIVGVGSSSAAVAGGCHGGPDLPLHFVAEIATIQAHKN
jgi:hypothetical protein